MSEFLYLYRATPAARNEAMGSPERAQQSMQRWVAWLGDLEKGGHLKNGGQPLDGGGKVVRGTAKSITDGPFVEAKDVIGGYSIVQAKDVAEAAELAKGCPILDGGGSVEVRPILPL